MEANQLISIPINIIRKPWVFRFSDNFRGIKVTQLMFTCSKSTIEALEKGVKHAQS